MKTLTGYLYNYKGKIVVNLKPMPSRMIRKWKSLRKEWEKNNVEILKARMAPGIASEIWIPIPHKTKNCEGYWCVPIGQEVEYTPEGTVIKIID